MNIHRMSFAQRALVGASVALILLVILGPAFVPPVSPSFDFAISGGRELSVVQGGSASEVIIASLSSGAARSIEFAASGLPAGATYSFSTATCTPPCSTTLTIQTTWSTPVGRHAVDVTAFGDGRTRFASLVFTVTASGPPASTKFRRHNRVRTTGRAPVRSSASLSATLLATSPPGALGTIIGGPVAADGLIWWNVSYDSAPSGWSEEATLAKESAATGLRGDCSSEAGLVGRSDIVFCEPWEDPAWWQNGYVSDGTKTRPHPVTPAQVDRTSVVTGGCVSGKCLEVNMLKGESGALAVHWPLNAALQHPEELFVRYYLKLSSNFSPNVCSPDGVVIDSGGKFPGPADVRTDADPGGQCGNGGNPADGVHCWSLRTKFRDCSGGSSGPACSVRGAVTRVGHYAYFYRSLDFWGVGGYWDAHPWDQSTGDGGTCRTTANNMLCGIGRAGNLLANRWYRIEMRVRMNTPGEANGVLQAWVDGVKAFDKTNMIYRLPGHDGLHVRTMWLNVHTGGDYPNGNCANQKMWLDQMVLATGGLPGPWAP